MTDAKRLRRFINGGCLGILRNKGTCKIYPGNMGTWPKLKRNKGTSTCPGIRESIFFGKFFQGFCKLSLKVKAELNCNRSLCCFIIVKQTCMLLFCIVLRLTKHFSKSHKCEKIETMMC